MHSNIQITSLPRPSKTLTPTSFPLSTSSSSMRALSMHLGRHFLLLKGMSCKHYLRAVMTYCIFLHLGNPLWSLSSNFGIWQCCFQFFSHNKKIRLNTLWHVYIYIYYVYLIICIHIYIYIWNWSPYSQSNRQNKPFSSGQMCQPCCTHEWKTQ